MAESVSEWRALIVDEVDERGLLPGATRLNGTQPDLPTRMVKLPVNDINQVAVVSWRWDGDLHTKGSRNIAGVVQCAKQRGVRYLFIDIISIDQQLHGGALIKQVTAFSALYTTIPVFAAYDMADNRLRYTVRRPWILSEIRLFRYNPTKIVYVGHIDGQGTVVDRYYFPGMQPLYIRQLSFGELVEEVWRTGFIDTIIAVLLGNIGMSFVSDFKFIIPAYADILSAAYEQMTLNDYLLTAAVLCRVHGAIGNFASGGREERSIQSLTYDRYNFSIVPPPPKDPHSKSPFYGIFLGGIQIAVWKHKRNRYLEWNRYEFELLPNAERVVFTELGLQESEYEDYVAQEGVRRACLIVDHTSAVPPPAIEVITASL